MAESVKLGGNFSTVGLTCATVSGMGTTPPGETRRKVLDFVVGRLDAGDPPSVREVAGAMDFKSFRTAQYHLEKLVQEGRLEYLRGQHRGYRIPKGEAI